MTLPCLSLVALAAAGSAGAATLTVGAGQTYTTIQSAFNAVNAGDIVLIKAGTYPESPTLSRSGTSSSMITVTSESGNSATVVKGNILLSGSYIHLEGLKVDGYNGTTYSKATGVAINGSNNEVVRMHVQNFGGIGINIGGGGHYAGYNYVYNVANGIHIADNSTAEFNVLERMNYNGNTNTAVANCDYFQGFGSNIIIRGNLAYGTIESEANKQHTDFFQSWNKRPSTNVYVINNVAMGPALSNGVQINRIATEDQSVYLTGWTIRNNIFLDWVGNGVNTEECPSWVVENNLLRGAPSAAGGNNGVCFTGTHSSGTVYNNILFDTVSPLRVQSGATITADYNLSYLYTNTPSQHGHDIIGSDPKFVDETKDDYRLLSTSPAINAGTSRSFTYDNEYSIRPQGGAYDIGPFEYGATPSLVREIENLVVDATTGQPLTTYSDAQASGGAWDAFSASAVNDYVAVRVPFPTPGTFNVSIRVKKGPGRCKMGVSVAAPGGSYTPVGNQSLDLYATAYGFVDLPIGSVTVPSAGCQIFKFTVTGAGTDGGYSLTLDAIKMTGQ